MSNKKALPLLFLVMFLVMIGFGIIIPVLPFFAEDLGASEFQLGLLMATYSLMQFLFAPMWGRLSDRIGRKPVMLIGIAGLSLSFFLFAFSSEMWMLFAARILAGFLSSANMPTVMAYVADVTTPENRGKGMGMIGAAVGLGFVFGPAIGGIFGKTSFQTPFLLAGATSAITFVFVLLVLKESLPKEQRTGGKAASARFGGAGGSLTYLYVLMAVVSLSLAGLETTFAYFGAERAGLDTENLGYIFMIMGLAGAFVQGGLIGRLIKKYGEHRVIVIGLLVSALGFGLILLIYNFLTAALFLTVFGIGNGFMRPSVSSLITKRSVGATGSASGVLSSYESLGRIAGPPLGGFLYQFSSALPYISGILLSLAALSLFFVFKNKDKFEEKTVTSA